MCIFAKSNILAILNKAPLLRNCSAYQFRIKHVERLPAHSFLCYHKKIYLKDLWHVIFLFVWLFPAFPKTVGTSKGYNSDT